MTLSDPQAPAGKLSRPAIEIDNLNKWFGSYHALRDVSLTVGEQEIMVVCGPSGSGKTTLPPPSM